MIKKIDLLRKVSNLERKQSSIFSSKAGYARCLFFFLFPLFLAANPNQGSIMLHNDTTMILTAVVQASDGSYLAQFSVQPGEQKRFTSNLYNTKYQVPGQPSISLTPYTVTWQCPSEGIFSMCTDVSPGAYVKATVCDKGTHFCSPKKKIEKKAPASHFIKEEAHPQERPKDQ